MKRHTLLGMAVLSACLLFFVGCGGGGGATITPSVNTPIPTINNQTLSGTITNVLSGEVVPNAMLTINGQQIKAGDDGKYSCTPSSTSGTIVVTGGAVDRTVPYDLSLSSTKNISILPTGFDVANYWAYQWPGTPQEISLWAERPRGFVICTKTWESGTQISDEVINNLKQIIATHINPLHPEFADMTVETFDGNPADYPGIIDSSNSTSAIGLLGDGRIFVSFADNMVNANGMTQCVINGNQILGGGVVLLNREDILSTYLQYVFLHEAGHALFNFYHPFQNLASATASIMNYDHTVMAFTDFDKSVINAMCRRCAGTYYPDNDPSGTGGFSSKEEITLGEIHADNFTF